jgi:aldose 1-epimerase
MTLSGQQYVIEAGPHRATVVEVGAGLQHYTRDGVDVTVPYGDDVLPPKCCGVTLVPWPNRIRDGQYTFEGTRQQLALTEPAAHNAIHGLGRWARWRKVRQEPDRIRLRLDIVPQNGYPFAVRAEVTYALDPEHGLTVTLGARNNGPTRAPFGAGSHPYLAVPGASLSEATVTLPAREILVADDRQVPVGAQSVGRTKHDFRRGKRLRDLRMDLGFTGLTLTDGRGTAEVRTRHGGARLWFEETFQFLQVFTVDELVPGRAGIAIEPMTCAPDAFNSGAGLIVLEPGGAWTGSWGITPL